MHDLEALVKTEGSAAAWMLHLMAWRKRQDVIPRRREDERVGMTTNACFIQHTPRPAASRRATVRGAYSQSASAAWCASKRLVMSAVITSATTHLPHPSSNPVTSLSPVCQSPTAVQHAQRRCQSTCGARQASVHGILVSHHQQQRRGKD